LFQQQPIAASSQSSNDFEAIFKEIKQLRAENLTLNEEKAKEAARH